MKIRSATPADSTAITNLLQSIAGVWQADCRSDAVQRCVAAADGLAFVAVEHGQVLGFISGHDVGFRAYVSEFAVAFAPTLHVNSSAPDRKGASYNVRS